MQEDAYHGSDEQLVQEIKGDFEKVVLWDVLLRRYQTRLYSLAYRNCNSNREDTADLLQEIHLALVEAIPNFRGEARVSTLFTALPEMCATSGSENSCG